MRLWMSWWWPLPEVDHPITHLPSTERITLRDGTTAWIRPMTPVDRELHLQAYERLSPETKFHRFLTPMPELSPQLLERLVDGVDGVDHVALYVFVDGQESALPVSVGRVVRDPDHPDTADVAVTVQDEWQGRGLATALLRVLMALRPEGVTKITTVVSEGNPASLAMLKRLGPHTVTQHAGVYEVRIRLRCAESEEPPREEPEEDLRAEWREQLRELNQLFSWMVQTPFTPFRWAGRRDPELP